MADQPTTGQQFDGGPAAESKIRQFLSVFGVRARPFFGGSRDQWRGDQPYSCWRPDCSAEILECHGDERALGLPEFKLHFNGPLNRTAMDVVCEHPTLAHLLQWRAQIDPDRTAYVFLEDGDSETAQTKYGELDARAHCIAAQLAMLNARGERALLIYPAGLDFAAALFGCFYAGVIAVPAIPEQSPRAIDRFRKIVADSQSTLVLTTATLFRMVQSALTQTGDLRSLRWILTDESTIGCVPDYDDPLPNSEDLALIQYTSGSTSEPKGIAVSHANIMANQRMFGTALQTTEETRIVTWLPIYHDLGLIGQLLHGPYVGGLCVLMPPGAFLQKPIRWLRAISKYRGTYSASPNFGYELCLRKIAEADCQSLDLSCWTLAVNAAEPVRDSTIRDFEKRFGPYGFSQQAFFPAYGLAEATVCVSGGPCNRGAISIAVDSDALAQHRVEVVQLTASKARFLVACGEPQLDEETVIVDPDSFQRLRPDRVGEIWVRGPNVAKGYWNRPDETEQTFCAQLSDWGEGPYLRTGDLGFLRDGQLYITGRLKDLIIVRGRNHYPQDIELTMEKSHPDLRPGCGAAFSHAVGDAEELVLVQETRDGETLNYAAIADTILRAVAEAHGMVPQRVVLVPPRAVFKTSSGKIARRACREALRLRELPVLFESTVRTIADPADGRVVGEVNLADGAVCDPGALPSEVADVLEEILAEKADPSAFNARLIEDYGVNSLEILDIIERLERRFKLRIPTNDIEKLVTFGDLVAYVSTRLPADS
jgi:acyl carrier protein